MPDTMKCMLRFLQLQWYLGGGGISIFHKIDTGGTILYLQCNLPIRLICLSEKTQSTSSLVPTFWQKLTLQLQPICEIK